MHVSTVVGPPPGFLPASPRARIDHRLSGPNARAPTRSTLGGRRPAQRPPPKGKDSCLSLSLRVRASGPIARASVRLLGPCFETGRTRPWDHVVRELGAATSALPPTPPPPGGAGDGTSRLRPRAPASAPLTPPDRPGPRHPPPSAVPKVRGGGRGVGRDERHVDVSDRRVRLGGAPRGREAFRPPDPLGLPSSRDGPTLRRSGTVSPQRFQALFNLLSGFFSPFPRGTC